jgi:hypothetical protein
MTNREVAVAAAVGAAVFLGCCLLVGGGLLDHAPYGDVHVYRHYGELMRAGQLPYRDFFDEYPPFAQAVFLFPTLAGGGYATLFKWTMAACGAASVVLLVVCLRYAEASRRALWTGVGAAAFAPLLAGPIFLNAYDLFPALLVVAALAALLSGRRTPCFVLLGLAAAAKVYPLAPAAVAAAWVWRREGTRALRQAMVGFVVAAVAVSAWGLVGAGGLRFSARVQLQRGLEEHSLGGAILRAADRLGLYDATIRNRPPGSDDVIGSAARIVGAASSLLELAAVALVVVLVLRGPPNARRLLVGAAAAVLAVVAFQKVFSAQYVDWLVPAVPAAGALPSVLAAGVLALTRVVFAHGGAVWALLARDLLVVGIFALLVARLRRPDAA